MHRIAALKPDRACPGPDPGSGMTVLKPEKNVKPSLTVAGFLQEFLFSPQAGIYSAKRKKYNQVWPLLGRYN
jgi:hypothetical protein